MSFSRMSNVQVLDCTLRDGGYINEWHFGKDVIDGIIDRLSIANVDIIEIGYYSHSKIRNDEYSIYSDLDKITELMRMYPNNTFAIMINYGECEIEKVPDAEGEGVIFRVAFHKKDKDSALDFCKKLIKKGHKAFVQPMGAANYSDGEFMQLIKEVNKFFPTAFYIVDSFGDIELEDFKRLLYLADNNLSPEILLGYHSHNNLQQAYSNSKYFVEQHLIHDIIVDASVFGMGRGAGNLNLELFSRYLNNTMNTNYNIEPMLEIIDEHLRKIYMDNYWGYSLPFFLSASNNCHPNYASYFSDKNTLSVKKMNEILSMIPEDKRATFSKEYAEELYLEFQSRIVDDKQIIDTLIEKLKNRKILAIAPGKSISEQKEKVEKYIKENEPVIFMTNFVTDMYDYDYVFCTNNKRIAGISGDMSKVIVSSNIDTEKQVGYVVNYSSVRVNNALVSDNVMLMLLRLFINMGIRQVAVAGFDGYDSNPEKNFFDNKFIIGNKYKKRLQKNEEISLVLEEISRKINIEYVTDSIFKERA